MITDPTELLSAYFTGVLDAEGHADLVAWVNASQANADLFVQFAIEQQALENFLRIEKYGDLAELTLSDFSFDANGTETDPKLLTSLAEMEASAMTAGPVSITERLEQERLDRLREADRARAVLEPVLPQGPRVIVIPRIAAWGSIAAVLLLGLFLVLHYGPTTPADRPVANDAPPTIAAPPAIAAVFETNFESTWASPSPPSIGQTMTEGDYHLVDGRAKLRFQNGALVVVEAPARFTLDSGSAMTVHAGQVVAYCDVQAHGFTVQTPNAEFVDLGTEFGVRVVPNQESQLHVFKGEVRARAVGEHADENETVVVREAQAVTAKPQATSLISLAQADVNLFATTRRIDIPVANTGERISSDGDWDPAWQVTHVNGQLLPGSASTRRFTPPAPQPGRPELRFHPNVPGHISWITIDPRVADANEESYTFQTRFDVHEIDMQSLQLEMGFRADNYVSHIRLNGRSVTVPEHAQVPPFDALAFVRIEEGFVIGENILEVVIRNSINSINPESNYAALIAELKLTAQADWKQTANFRPAADE